MYRFTDESSVKNTDASSWWVTLTFQRSTDHSGFCFLLWKKSLKLSFVLKMRIFLLLLQSAVTWAKFGDKKEKTTHAKNPLPEHDTSKYAKFSIQDRYDLYESMGNIKDWNNFCPIFGPKRPLLVGKFHYDHFHQNFNFCEN